MIHGGTNAAFSQLGDYALYIYWFAQIKFIKFGQVRGVSQVNKLLSKVNLLFVNSCGFQGILRKSYAKHLVTFKQITLAEHFKGNEDK